MHRIKTPSSVNLLLGRWVRRGRRCFIILLLRSTWKICYFCVTWALTRLLLTCVLFSSSVGFFQKQVYKQSSKFSPMPFSTECSFVFASFSSYSCCCVWPIRWHPRWQQWLNSSVGMVSRSVDLSISNIIRLFRLGFPGHVHICSSSAQVSTTVDTRIDHLFDCFSLCSVVKKIV